MLRMRKCHTLCLTNYKVRNLSQKDILEGIKKRDNKTLEFIYEDYYPYVRRVILNLNGGEEDARDVFQEGIIYVYNKLNTDNDFIVDNLRAYLTVCCKQIWFKLLRRQRSDSIDGNPVVLQKTEEYQFSDEKLDKQLRESIFRKQFLKLPIECRNILQWGIDGIKTSEIAKKMGYKSEKIVHNKTYKCKALLIENIKKDPDYQDLG